MLSELKCTLLINRVNIWQIDQLLAYVYTGGKVTNVRK